MVQPYYGFDKEPFGATPDPRCLYSSNTHKEALASLKVAFHGNRGFTAMIAPPGMGKTTLLLRFLEDIKPIARSVFLFNIDSDCEPRELLGCILRDIDITPGRTNAEMRDQLNTALLAEAKAGRKFVVVIDEAQNLPDVLLETVRTLTNFETSQAKLIQIVLAGQPQLSVKLMQPSLLQLRQRISTVCRLNSLSAQETADYIHHRIDLAGYRGSPLFTNNALDMIAETSQGVPRTINNLCFNALLLCRGLKSKQVNAEMMTEVIDDQKLIPQARVAPLSNWDSASVRSVEPIESMSRNGRLLIWSRVAAMAGHSYDLVQPSLSWPEDSDSEHPGHIFGKRRYSINSEG